jgi:hypothetical protein
MRKFYILFGRDDYGCFSRRFKDKETAISTTRQMVIDNIAKNQGEPIKNMLVLESLRECYEGGKELIWDVDLTPDDEHTCTYEPPPCWAIWR